MNSLMLKCIMRGTEFPTSHPSPQSEPRIFSPPAFYSESFEFKSVFSNCKMLLLSLLTHLLSSKLGFSKETTLTIWHITPKEILLIELHLLLRSASSTNFHTLLQ